MDISAGIESGAETYYKGSVFSGRSGVFLGQNSVHLHVRLQSFPGYVIRIHDDPNGSVLPDSLQIGYVRHSLCGNAFHSPGGVMNCFAKAYQSPHSERAVDFRHEDTKETGPMETPCGTCGHLASAAHKNSEI
jgi:hypothetical protein